MRRPKRRDADRFRQPIRLSITRRHPDRYNHPPDDIRTAPDKLSLLGILSFFPADFWDKAQKSAGKVQRMPKCAAFMGNAAVTAPTRGRTASRPATSPWARRPSQTTAPASVSQASPPPSTHHGTAASSSEEATAQTGRASGSTSEELASAIARPKAKAVAFTQRPAVSRSRRSASATAISVETEGYAAAS